MVTSEGCRYLRLESWGPDIVNLPCDATHFRTEDGCLAHIEEWDLSSMFEAVEYMAKRKK
jgi:hypothetical protein